MCRSVPQIPVHSTRIFTSLLPGSGSGTFSSQRPRSAWLLTRAFIPNLLQQSHPVRRNQNRKCGLFALRAFRDRRDWGAGPFRPLTRQTIRLLGFSIGFFHFGYGVGQKTEDVAETAAHALPPVLTLLTDVTV